MPLTNTAVQNAKPKEKTYRLFDSGGLYLEVTKTGAKYWRMKYRFDGKEKWLAVGVYPSVSIKEAKEKQRKAKKLLEAGIDPNERKKTAKQAAELESFELVVFEWYDKHKEGWEAGHSKKVLSRLQVVAPISEGVIGGMEAEKHSTRYDGHQYMAARAVCYCTSRLQHKIDMHDIVGENHFAAVRFSSILHCNKAVILL